MTNPTLPSAADGAPAPAPADPPVATRADTGDRGAMPPSPTAPPAGPTPAGADPLATLARPWVAIVGGGPAGLAAAEELLAAGQRVVLFDAMPSLGRKFLLAGKGGLNLTHSEPAEPFTARYAEAADWVGQWLAAPGGDAAALRDWAQGLGIDTFVGSSGRVFPQEMKAAPLLRGWLHRLRAAGLVVQVRQRWSGWLPGDAPTTLRLDTPAGPRVLQPDALVLALGGGSWPQLGSDGAWQPWLAARGVALAPLRAANCGFDLATPWSAHFVERHAGAPLKSVRLRFDQDAAATGAPAFDRAGECVVTASGIEGSLVYAASARVREAIARDGQATIHLDLLPGRDAARLATELGRGRGSRSVSSHLKAQIGLDGVKAALLRERWSAEELTQRLARDPAGLAAELKAWPLVLGAPRPMAEAISSAGGVRREALDATLQLTALPGVACCGEMLDWEAPTGGYLLTAAFASGRVAGRGLAQRLTQGG
jgi:uncharacterized flavoprotein (TIGR03862 family)